MDIGRFSEVQIKGEGANVTFSSQEITSSSIAVVGIVKNVEKSIKNDLARLETALSRFVNVKWFLVESNSSDNTVPTLHRLAQKNPNFRFVSLSNSNNHHSRIPGMSEARNRYLEELRVNESFQDCDFVVVADFNALNDLLDQAAIDSCFNREDWDICCANQDGPYYDIWALRHPLWSPNDCWQEHKFLRKYIKYPEKALYAAVHSRMIRIPRDSEWIEVDSAFGGFAIYRREIMLKSNYSPVDDQGNITCEHVPFHTGLRNLGARIFINPELINTRFTDHNRESTFKNKLIRQLNYPLKFIWAKNGR